MFHCGLTFLVNTTQQRNIKIGHSCPVVIVGVAALQYGLFDIFGWLQYWPSKPNQYSVVLAMVCHSLPAFHFCFYFQKSQQFPKRLESP